MLIGVFGYIRLLLFNLGVNGCYIVYGIMFVGLFGYIRLLLFNLGVNGCYINNLNNYIIYFLIYFNNVILNLNGRRANYI